MPESGINWPPGSNPQEKSPRHSYPLTPEEEAYFKDYLSELPELSIDTKQAFAGLAEGNQEALQALTAHYMKETARMAAEPSYTLVLLSLLQPFLPFPQSEFPVKSDI